MHTPEGFVPHPFVKAASHVQLDYPLNQLRHMRISELRQQLQHAKSADCLIGSPELVDLLRYPAQMPSDLGNKQQVVAQQAASQSSIQQNPTNNCCAAHGDVPSKRGDFQDMMRNHVIQLRRDGAEPVPITPSLLAITKYWDPFLKAERMSKKKQRDRVFRFTAQRVCKLHQFNKCNYGVECRNIHICRYFWTHELPAILESLAQEARQASKSPNTDFDDDDDPMFMPADPGDEEPEDPGPPPAPKPVTQQSAAQLLGLPPHFYGRQAHPGASQQGLPELQTAVQSLAFLQSAPPPPPPPPPHLPYAASSPALSMSAPQPLGLLANKKTPGGLLGDHRDQLYQQQSQTMSRGQPRHRQYLMMQPALQQPVIQPPAQPIPQPAVQAPGVIHPVRTMPPPASLQRSPSTGKPLQAVGLPGRDPPPLVISSSSAPGAPLSRRLLRNVSRAELDDLPVRPVRPPSAGLPPAAPAGHPFLTPSPSTLSAMDWAWQLAALGVERYGKPDDAPKESISNDEYRAMLTCVAEKRPHHLAAVGSANSFGSSDGDLMEKLMEKLPLDLQKELDAAVP